MNKNDLREYVLNNPNMVSLKETSREGVFVLKYKKKVFYKNLWNELSARNYLELKRWNNSPVCPVPLHLRNAPTKLMKQLDYGKDYRYAHNEGEGYAAGENYFPEGLPEVSFYQPAERGLEAKIAEKLAHLRELDAAAKKNEK